MDGWLKIYRQIYSHPLWTMKPFDHGHAWIDLLILANHEDGFIIVRGVHVPVKRGQVGWSEVKLADRWGWSRTKLRNFLNTLEKEQQIRQQKNNVSMLISITNYDRYQQKEQPKEQQQDSRRTAEEQQKDTNKKNKEEKNKDLVDFFEKLWSVYPRKDGKKGALRHYLASVTSEEDMEHINLALGAYIEAVKDTELRFIKKGETWFNNWQDWIPQEAA